MNYPPVLIRFFFGVSLILCLTIASAGQGSQPTFVNPPNIKYSGGTVELTGAKATID